MEDLPRPRVDLHHEMSLRTGIAGVPSAPDLKNRDWK